MYYIKYYYNINKSPDYYKMQYKWNMNGEYFLTP